MIRKTICQVWASGMMMLFAAGMAMGAEFPAIYYAAEGAEKILRYGADGKVDWEYPAPMSRDVQQLPNGNILFCYNERYDSRRHDNPSGVMEVTPEKKVVFHFCTTGQVWSCQRLPDGTTLVGAASQGKLLLVNPKGKVARTITLRSKPGHSCLRHARGLANGHFLAAEESGKAAREYDAEGKMVREIRVPFSPFSAARLENGNTIISGKDGIVEVDAADRVVWQVRATELAALGIRWMAGFVVQPDGNLLVVNAGGKVPLFEIARDAAKRVVWQVDPEKIKMPFGHGISLAGKGNADGVNTGVRVKEGISLSVSVARGLESSTSTSRSTSTIEREALNQKPAALSDLLEGKFQWVAGPALIGPGDPRLTAIKDPTVVYSGGRWHVYTTIREPGKQACMEYLSFADWEQADKVPRRIIRLTDGYHCAPQIFFFTPHKKWYLLFQYTDRSQTPPFYGPAVATLEDPAKPETLSKPVMLYDAKPDNVKGWLDFWIICDKEQAHLFFTSDDGRMWHSQTRLAEFPKGWDRPAVVLKGDIFEASCTYKMKGMEKYLTIIEAQRKGTRYYKAYLADRLDGEWKPVADTWEKPFAGMTNVKFAPGMTPWTDAISHGELIRDGVDETMTIDPAKMQFLFQGCTAQERGGKNYGQFPWRLGILDAVK